MAQHVKVLAAKPKHLSSTRSTEPKEKDSCQVVLTSTHMSSSPLASEYINHLKVRKWYNFFVLDT